ncbi:MAG: exodeoxyribonuclease VII large subunit [Coriobacteriia bacterium]|nr:exodeoxyribonuclease VII large subunit [Coriobacteriia bacterium]
MERPETYSVSDALMIAKIGLETIHIKIIGEVSELNAKPGYKAVYFTIKDKNSALPCLMWKNRYMAMDADLELGSMVEVEGRFSLYQAKGRMNFDVESYNLAGEGELRMQVAKLAKKLEKEGLTSIERKKPIPEFTSRVGVVTSPRGAVIHDILRTINRRMPTINVVFAGCAVEGNNAPSDMIAALDLLDKQNCDVIILARGGGSFEDLMPFNDEALALKIVDMETPVITGIGHEPDNTIADLVSDFRASTPTAAAEKVSYNLVDYISNYTARLDNVKRSTLNRLQLTRDRLNDIASRPIFADPTKLFASDFQTLDYIHEKLISLDLLKDFNNQVSLAAAKLEDKSPLTILSRGYSATTDVNGKLVKSINDVNIDDDINVAVSDGIINARIRSKHEQEN